MALLNNYYIFAESEKVTRGVDVTSHPVESGISITDNVKRKAVTLSISGKIVKVGNTKSSTTLNAITELHQNGKYVKYQGRNTISNALITSFETKHNAEINGGCEFDMEIQEVRIAKSAYKASAKTSTTTKQVTSKKSTQKSNTRYYTVKTGDCLWSIAQKYYGNGAQYPKIYNANKAQIDKRNKGYNVDKYTIYTGQRFEIP